MLIAFFLPSQTSDGQCLFVDPTSGDFRENLTPVQTAACNGSTSQQWDVITAGIHNNVPGAALIVSTLVRIFVLSTINNTSTHATLKNRLMRASTSIPVVQRVIKFCCSPVEVERTAVHTFSISLLKSTRLMLNFCRWSCDKLSVVQLRRWCGTFTFSASKRQQRHMFDHHERTARSDFVRSNTSIRP